MARITFEDLVVDYPVYSAQAFSLRRTLINFASGGLIGVDGRSHVKIRALDGVSFTIADGDRVGLVGRNGAGKSTLLRVLAGICAPTSGRIEIEGRTTFLFDPSSCMDGELTGYENIRIVGTILGLSRRQTRQLVPGIEAFTELGDYLRLPVRTYSTGMKVRLSFALMTSVEPEILLLDEAIGAGDHHFYEKAKQRAQELYERSRIMVLASHSNDLLRQLCNKAILLHQGRVLMSGPVADVLARYDSPQFDVTAPVGTHSLSV